MRIEQRRVTIRDVAEGYFNDAEEGVEGYNGLLDIRPRYQREFVYKDRQRDEVIRTIMKGLPLNVMYWCRVKRPDGTDGYEVMDGQQRTISFCEYVDGTFSVDNRYFSNLPSDIKKRILDYELFIYVCDGTDSEKLDWFRIINIAGEKLTDQELRNAVYAGPWTADAKRYFSKTGCVASQIAGDYLKGSSIRQEFLETALGWMAARDGDTIEGYMSKHQDNANAVELWNYFRSVIDWTRAIFPVYRKEMRGLPWGLYYNEHGKRSDLDSKELESEIQRLMGDEDVTSKSGIYEYLLTGREERLSIRAFDRREKLAAYERQGHRCAICGKEFRFEEMHGDHIVAWSNGGHTTPDNCQMLCRDCNLRKGSLRRGRPLIPLRRLRRMTHRAADVSREILTQAISRGIYPTNMRLQAILYLSWVHYLERTKRHLFGEPFEARRGGPIAPASYYENWLSVARPIFIAKKPEADMSDVSAFIGEMLDRYGGTDMRELGRMVRRRNGPWDLSYEEGESAEIPLGLVER